MFFAYIIVYLMEYCFHRITFGLEFIMNRMRLGVGLTMLIIFLFTAPIQAYVLGPTDPGKWGSPLFGTGATVT